MVEGNKSHSIIALDLVRGLAALAVVFGHVRGGNWVEFGALPAAQKTVLTSAFFFLTRLGHEAVLVFFVLSGFLVGGNLIERVQARRFNFEDYAVDRVTRILIPLAPACVLTAAINVFGFGQLVHVGQVLGNIVGLNGIAVETLENNAPLWSLAYEIWFYVLAGSLALVLSGSASIRPFVGILICILIFAKLDARYVLIWGMGAITMQIVNKPGAKWLFAPGLVLTIAGIVLYQMASGSKSFDAPISISPGLAEAILCSGFCLCIPLLHDAKFNAMLMGLESPARLLSQISFSLYLVHSPLNAYLCFLIPKAFQIDAASLMTFSLKLVAALSLAAIFWALFERPSFKLRKILKAGRFTLQHEKA